jgi:hypothetical protein
VREQPSVDEHRTARHGRQAPHAGSPAKLPRRRPWCRSLLQWPVGEGSGQRRRASPPRRSPAGFTAGPMGACRRQAVLRAGSPPLSDFFTPADRAISASAAVPDRLGRHAWVRWRNQSPGPVGWAGRSLNFGLPPATVLAGKAKPPSSPGVAGPPARQCKQASQTQCRNWLEEAADCKARQTSVLVWN